MAVAYGSLTYAAAEHEAEIKRQILAMYLECKTQQQIADAVRVSQKTVDREIADFSQSGKFADSTIFRNYEQDDCESSGRRIYTVWNFSKATNEVRHFGNIPPEIIDNLLYLFTKPLDVVFDPFGGVVRQLTSASSGSVAITSAT